jgi:hypothetical protein
VKGDLASVMVSQKNRRAVDDAHGRGGRLVASLVRWQVVTEPLQCGCMRAHVLDGTCGHGPSWASGKRALSI